MATATVNSRSRARIGTQLTRSAIQRFRANASFWAAISGEYYVVHYERGGIAHTYHILIAKIANDNGKPKLIWRAVGGPFKDYAAFLNGLRNGKLDDRLDWH